MSLPPSKSGLSQTHIELLTPGSLTSVALSKTTTLCPTRPSAEAQASPAIPPPITTKYIDSAAFSADGDEFYKERTQ
jgi:hypothetical protein